jgi:hypothetical protein
MPSFTIDPQNATVAGKSIEQWTEAWWKWVLQGPRDPFNPTDDKTGLLSHINNNGDVFFLAGTNGVTGAGGDAMRFIAVPHGKPILVPMLNSFDVEGPNIPGSDPLDPKGHINTVIDGFLKSVTDVFAKIDGKTVVDFQSSGKYLETTGFFDMGPTKPGSLANQAGVPVGVELKDTKATGFYAMLENLSRGVHTIEFGGTGGGITTHTTDHILVV